MLRRLIGTAAIVLLSACGNGVPSTTTNPAPEIVQSSGHEQAPTSPDAPPPVSTQERASTETVEAPKRDYLYDDSWSEDAYWPGEYPEGLYVFKEGVSLSAREKPSPAFQPTLTCPLEFKGVYHPWNGPRNIAKDLKYKAMTKTVSFVLTKPLDVTIFDSADPVYGEKTVRTLEAGEKVTFLAYIGEGWAQFKVGDLEFEQSMDIFGDDIKAVNGLSQYDLWLGLDCGDQRGWILLDDVKDIPGVIAESRSDRGYGEMADLSDEDVQEFIANNP